MLKLIIALLIVTGAYAIEWALTVLFFKLITLCFSWDFSLAAATDVWLIMSLIRNIFQRAGGIQ